MSKKGVMVVGLVAVVLATAVAYLAMQMNDAERQLEDLRTAQNRRILILTNRVTELEEFGQLIVENVETLTQDSQARADIADLEDDLADLVYGIDDLTLDLEGVVDCVNLYMDTIADAGDRAYTYYRC